MGMGSPRAPRRRPPTRRRHDGTPGTLTVVVDRGASGSRDTSEELRSGDLANRRFTADEYEHMAAAGIISPDERVELIDGEILVMAPQGERHVLIVHGVQKLLEAAFGDSCLDRKSTRLNSSHVAISYA